MHSSAQSEHWHLQSEQQFTLGQTSFQGAKKQNEDAIGIVFLKALFKATRDQLPLLQMELALLRRAKKRAKHAFAIF
jgi:hypothetical protein